MTYFIGWPWGFGRDVKREKVIQAWVDSLTKEEQEMIADIYDAAYRKSYQDDAE